MKSWILITGWMIGLAACSKLPESKIEQVVFRKSSCRASYDDPFACVSEGSQNLKFDVFQMDIFTYKGTFSRSQFLENLLVTEVRLAPDPGSRGHVRYYYEPDPKRYALILQRESQALPSKLFLPDHPIILEAWDKILDLHQKKQKQVEFFTEDGCAGHCVIKYKYPVFKNHRILEITYFS